LFIVFALAYDSTITKDLVLDELDFAILFFYHEFSQIFTNSFLFSLLFVFIRVNSWLIFLFTNHLSAIFTIKFRNGQIKAACRNVKKKQFFAISAIFVELECHFAIIIDCSSTIRFICNSETEVDYG